MARPFGYLAGKRTDQMLPPALARRASIYPLGGADVASGAALVREGAIQADELVLYTWNSRLAVAMAQMLVFNLRQIGVDVEVKYFDPTRLPTRPRRPGEPFDLMIRGLGVDYADAGAFFGPLLAPDGGTGLAVNFDDPASAAIGGGEPAHGRGPSARPWPTWTST